MYDKAHPALATIAALALLPLTASLATGQEEEEKAKTGWSDVAEVSLVATGGNTEGETLSLRNTLGRKWEKAKITIEAAALRAESTTSRPVAVGDPASFRVDENALTQLTAESYLLRGRYQRTLSPRRYWFAGGGWDRNEFAGIKNRVVAQGGIGTVWFDDEDGHFETDYGITFTDQEDLFGGSESFAGVRFAWDYQRKLTDTATYVNLLALDANADDTSDYRADLVNSLAVAISERLALKVSLQLLYDNQPSLRAVPLVGIDGTPSGATVLVPLDEIDSVLNVALVVDF